MNRRAFIQGSIPAAAWARTVPKARPYFSLFAYPWDVLDERPAAFARLAHSLGLTHISLASSYHGGKTLLPHNAAHRVYFIEDGAIYFPPADRFFAGVKMKPKVSRLAANGDIWKAIMGACRERGIRITAWTVSLHNTYLGTTYPEYTTRNAFGDRYPHALCPAQPEVQRYLSAVAGNLASYGVDMVDFEAFQFIPFQHYSFLEKTGIEITPFAGLLLSLCFCDACVSAAKRESVDGTKVEAAVRSWLTGYFDGGNRGPEQSGSVPGLNDYLEMRYGVLEQCFAAVSNAAHTGGAKTIYMVFGEQSPDPLGGVDLVRLARHADAVEHLFYGRKAEDVPAVMRNLRRACGERNIYSVLRPGYPDVRDAAGLAQTTTAAIRAGCGGVSYYNFGLVERSHMGWIRHAIAIAG